MLLKIENIDINIREKTYNMTPLFAACQYGYYKVIRHLLQHPKVEVNK